VAKKLTRANFDAIRDHLFDRIHKNGELLKNDFPNILRAAIESEAWKHFADPNGRPFKNLVEWLHSTYPHGASMGQGTHAISYDEAVKLTEGVSDVHRVLAAESPSKRVREETAKSPPPRRYKPSMSARLQQQHPKAYQQYLFGEIRSISAAGKAAGLVKERPPQNLARAKAAYTKMTAEERAEFLEWIHSPDAKNSQSKKRPN
jgi:hypothetical protein